MLLMMTFSYQSSSWQGNSAKKNSRLIFFARGGLVSQRLKTVRGQNHFYRIQPDLGGGWLVRLGVHSSSLEKINQMAAKSS